jgi:hypothetical protein
MKDLNDRITKLEGQMRPRKPAMVVRSGWDLTEAKKQYFFEHRCESDVTIEIVRSTSEH